MFAAARVDCFYATMRMRCTSLVRRARARSNTILSAFTNRSINELDKLLRNILGLYFFSATLTLCSATIQLTSQQMNAMKIVSLLQYMSANLTQLFLFCSYGDAVLNESSVGPGEGPFCAALWCLGPKIRREIAILSFGMMLPRKLHAGAFNTLDLPTFIQIVRTAYSSYAVLGTSKAT